MSAILLRKPLPPSSATIAERLRAHARLCQHIAELSWSEETAAKLGRLAEDCTKAARDADSVRQDR
jgi:hypothetical protein